MDIHRYMNTSGSRAKAALKRQPEIQFLATLYTPPPWMKTNNDASGGGEARATINPVHAADNRGIPSARSPPRSRHRQHFSTSQRSRGQYLASARRKVFAPGAAPAGRRMCAM